MATFDVTRDFPVTPERLFATVTDPAYLQVRGERFGGIGTPTVTAEDGDVRIETARRLPVDKLPSAAKKFIPGDGQLHQVDHWSSGDGAWRGHWAVSGTPAKVAGEHAITAAGAGARYTVRGETSLSVPLVGGKISNEIAKRIEELVGLEFDLLADYLAR